MSQQKGISFKEFRQRFQTEEACEKYLFQQRWPDGFVCPKCGRVGCYHLHGRREYVCKHCHGQSSVTAGTVLHHTHLPLTVWFWAIYLVARDKRGISAAQLSRELEIAYSSPWYLLHRLRKAMGQRDQDYSFPASSSWTMLTSARPSQMGNESGERRKPAHWQRCPLPGKSIPTSSKYKSPNWMPNQ